MLPSSTFLQCTLGIVKDLNSFLSEGPVEDRVAAVWSVPCPTSCGLAFAHIRFATTARR
jgi:hypothetical protein